MEKENKYTRNEDRRFTLRLNRELFDDIAKRAKENRRSIGREIEWILVNSLKNQSN